MRGVPGQVLGVAEDIIDVTYPGEAEAGQTQREHPVKGEK
jgi:hypothetical protein